MFRLFLFWLVCSLSQGLISFEEEYRERKQKKSEKINARIHRVLPTWADFKRVLPTYFRSSAIGTTIGAIPGTGEIYHHLSLITKRNVGLNTLKNLVTVHLKVFQRQKRVQTQ